MPWAQHRPAPVIPAASVLAMMTDVMSKQIHVLCDYDALYAAIELKLSSLPQVQVIRLESNPVERSNNGCLARDLIIVAPVPPIVDPMSILSRASLLDCVGQVPVLIVSEQPSRPESDDRITYLNFPFDMDDLSCTVVDILEKRPYSSPERAF
jgi:hypothetical protein